MSAWTSGRPAVARAVRTAGLVVAFTVLALALASQPHRTAKAGTIPDINRLSTAELAQRMHLKLPVSPTADEIHRVALLGSPLVPVGATSPAENRDLARALEAYDVAREGERHRDAVEPILRFLDTHPDSGWRPTLLVGLGAAYRRTGHFSKALSTWQRAWDIAKGFQDVDGRSVGDQAAAYLSQYEAYLGRKETLGPLLQEAQARSMTGTARDVVAQSAQGLADMLYQPQLSFRCGPMALYRILAQPGQKPSQHSIDVLQRAPSTPDGLSLAAVQAISVEADMNYQMAFRTPGAAMITPAVAHWKLGHYAAVAGRLSGDRYAIEDPTFGPDLTIDQATLDEEASGYFLLPQGPLPPGWRPVDPTEGATVWGRGSTGANHDDGATGPSALHAFPDHTCPGGCTTWNVEAEVVSLSLHDDPISYTPPFGPAMHFPVEYSQRDKQLSQSGLTYTSFGIGTPWTTDWTSFIVPGDNCEGIYNATPVLEIGSSGFRVGSRIA